MKTKSGLSYFSEGSSTTDAVDQPQDTTIAPLTKAAKMPASKAGYQFPTVSGEVPLDKNVLNAMEELYQNRQAEYGGFMEAMKDAYAWWSGDVAGPQQALSRRAAEREQQTANLFNMRTQIAQAKAAEERNNLVARSLRDELRAGGTGGFEYDPTTAAAINSHLNNNDVASALAVKKSFVGEMQKFAANPASFKPEIGFIDTSSGTPRANIQSAIDARSRVFGTGPRPPSEAAPRPLPQQTQPGATPQAGAAPQGAAPQAGAAPMPMGGGAPAPAAPMGGAAPAPRPAPQAAAPAPAAPRPAAPRPAAAPAPVARPGGQPNLLELQTAADIAKQKAIGMNQTIAGGVGKILEKEVVEGEVADKNAKEASTNEADYKLISNLASDPKTKKAFGILAHPDMWSSVMGLAEEGIRIGNSNVGIPGISDAIRKLGTKEEIEAAQLAGQALARLKVKAGQMAYQGQGAVSDYERRMVEKMIGDLSNTPEAIQRFMEWNSLRAKFDKANGKAWNDYQNRVGRESFYGDYKRKDPEYQRLKDEYEKGLARFVTATTKNVTRSTVSADEQAIIDKYRSKK